MAYYSSESVRACKQRFRNSIESSDLFMGCVARENDCTSVRSPLQFLPKVADKQVDVRKRLYMLQMGRDYLSRLQEFRQN